jgi:hypothetical protein
VQVVRSRFAVIVVFAALVAGACGSTVPAAQRARSAASAAAGEQGLGAQASTVDSEVAAALDSRAATQSSAVSRLGRTTGATRAVTSTNAGKDGPGVTDKTVTIGFSYVTNNEVAQAALGNTAATAGDMKGEAEAVLRDINKNGGVKGRTLAAVFHPVDATSTEPSDTIVQRACSDYTEDHKVLVGTGFGADAVFISCMSKAGAVTVSGALSPASDGQFRGMPLYYDVQALSTDSVVRNLVDALVKANYFMPWDTAAGGPGGALPVKVGILVPDQPQWDAVVSRVLLPELASHGIKVAAGDIQRWHFPDSTAGNAQSVSEIQGAVLRFHSDNVTHVLPLEVNSLGFFAQPAESQHYRPRYGVNSATGPQIYAGSLVPYAQLNGAVGVGWSPALDLPASTNFESGPYAGPGRAKCLSVMTAAGFSFSDANAKAVGLLICDELYSMRDAINAIPTGSPINATTYMRSVEGFGERFAIAGLPRGRFAPGKHYPVDYGYAYAFDNGCKCMTYRGAPYRLR